MGVETVLFAALTGLSAVSKLMGAQQQAQGVVDNASAAAKALKSEGELAAAEKAKQVRYAAARQTSSFLSSGITLEGTPELVLGETFDTGLADINNIKKGYTTQMNNVINQANAQSSNIVGAARTAAIGDIAGAFGNFSMGSFGFGGSANSFGGNLATSNAVYGGSGSDWIH